MGYFDDGCNTGLVLGLGISPATEGTPPSNKTNHINQRHQLSVSNFETSLSLSLPGDQIYTQAIKKSTTAGIEESAASPPHQLINHRQASSPHSHSISTTALSNSFSSGTRVVKRERDLSSEEIEVEKVISSSRASDEDEDGVNARKKLRLTKEQSALLEESFKLHSTLNPKQKQALARQLNLRPRQVEVWFQNRRARTKLKQTEVDCELLKKCCETLTDENRRLHKELQELKALKIAQPLYMHMPAATLTMCPSCERIADGNSKGPFPMGTKPHCYTPFTNPSAAC